MVTSQRASTGLAWRKTIIMFAIPMTTTQVVNTTMNHLNQVRIPNMRTRRMPIEALAVMETSTASGVVNHAHLSISIRERSCSGVAGTVRDLPIPFVKATVMMD